MEPGEAVRAGHGGVRRQPAAPPLEAGGQVLLLRQEGAPGDGDTQGGTGGHLVLKYCFAR